MSGERLYKEETETYQLNRRSISAFESDLLQKVLEKISELIAGLFSTIDQKQIIDKYATCKQTARLLKELRDRNDEHQVPYMLYSPELMLVHEKILDDTSIQYRRLLCTVLTAH